MVDTALFSVKDAAALCKGEYLGPTVSPLCREVVLDSRRIQGDELFVPLKGERTDGHYHIMQALEAGASGVLCRREFLLENRKLLAFRDKAAIIIVPDTLAALQALAEGYLAGFPQLLKIGITGSSGKTTTKEILGSIFSLFTPTVMNEGNLNSESGLPLSVLQVRGDHRFGIFEMGINHPGEMDVLVRVAKPQAAVITNVGSAHIGLLGSRERIAEEKRKIFFHLTSDGAAFLPEDEPYREYLLQGVSAPVVLFGPHSVEGYKDSRSLGLHGWEMQFADRLIHFPLIGEFNLKNALCGITVARYFGVDDLTICTGLERVKPLFGRGQILHGRATVLHDCYNANPHSLSEAIHFLDMLDWKGRKIAVLGAMKELGEETESAHEVITREAASSGLDLLCLVGEEFHATLETAERKKPGRVLWFSNTEDLCESITDLVGSGDIVLVKGSRDMALERITDFIV